MSKTGNPTCEECYFRKAGLCALAGNTVCPTFRVAQRGALAPPAHPTLVPRPLVAAHTAAA